MTDTEKLAMLRTFVPGASDAILSTYLDFAKREILAWKFNGDIPDGMGDVPTEDETTQVMACVAGYNLRGGENEVSHSENGIGREFKYSDMVVYIHSNVIPYARVRKS